MAVVRDNNKWNATLLTDLTSIGSDDGVTSDVVAWAVDQSNWYYPDTIAAGSSTWIAMPASQWAQETATTTDATPTTIATPIPTLLDNDQQYVECIIHATTADGSSTYFRHQLFVFYRDGGTATLWSKEIDGLNVRRTLTTATATLTTSTNAVIVQGTGEAATSLDWTTQFRTRDTVANGVSGSAGPTPSTGAAWPLLTSTTVTTTTTITVTEYQQYDPSGGAFTLNAPATPAAGNMFGIKNMSNNSTTEITLDGNGSNIEDPSSFALSATVQVKGDGIGLVYQYNGSSWVLV